MTPPVKLRREIEPRWVAEYVATFYPNATVKLRCHLGSIPESLTKEFGEAKALRIYRPSRSEVDACILQGRRIILVEAKVFKFMDGISKLPVYKSLVRVTPELQEFSAWPIDMQLLVAKKLDWVAQAASLNGIELKEWAPKWVQEIWDERDKYWTAEAQEKRDERKKVLRRLGYE